MKKILDTYKGSFSPLNNREFCYYLAGQAVSMSGTWLQMTAQGWVVWEISGSTASLGIVAMLGTLPIFLLGPLSGILADKVNRRKLLIASQACAMIIAAVLAFLVQTNLVQLWHIYLLAGMLGVVTAIDMPAQQAFIGDLSGMAHIRKAVNINAMVLHLSRMVGPALAGVFLSTLGTAMAFWINSLSFLAVICSLLVIRSNQIRSSRKGNAFADFKEGLNFVRQQPRIQDLIIFILFMTFFGLAIINIMPAVATQILHGNAKTLGFLMTSSGAGALTGAILLAPLAQSVSKIGKVIAGAAIWIGIWFIIFAFSASTTLSVVSLFLVSLGAPVVLTTSVGLFQVLAPPDMRARIMSLFMMVTFGSQPIASLFIGFSAEVLGVSTAILANGILLTAASILMMIFRPGFRDWELMPHLNREPFGDNLAVEATTS